MQAKFSKYLKKHFKIFFLFFGSIVFIAESCLAVAPHLTESDIPVKVNADDMVYDMDHETVTFIGNVVVTRGDFVMKSAKMKIFMQKNEEKQKIMDNPPQNMPLTGLAPQSKKQKTQKGQNEIERIEAVGGVTFDFDAQSGSSETAVYETRKGLLIMRGNPVVRDGENIIQGNTIRYYMYERRSEVIGSEKKRVEAIFSNKK